MNKEEKEAIDRIQKRIKDNEDYSTNQVWLTEDVRCARVVLNLIKKQENEINKLKETLNDRVDVKQTADSISFTMPSKVAAESIKILDETALEIENKRLCKLLEKQEKIIDKFSKALVNCVGTCPVDYSGDLTPECEKCNDNYEKCWIEYFKKEVEKEC